jgi:hypothetical protein
VTVVEARVSRAETTTIPITLVAETSTATVATAATTTTIAVLMILLLLLLLMVLGLLHLKKRYWAPRPSDSSRGLDSAGRFF